jgi:hypothetical protein
VLEMIRAYFGLPGAGKTYMMTQHAQKLCKGRDVYTNYDILAPGAKNIFKMDNPMDFLGAENGLVLIDEAGLWLPSFIWRSIPTQMIWKIAQTRKFGIDLLYTAQDPARVVKPLREITFESVYVKRFFKFVSMEYVSGIKGKPISREFSIINPKGTGSLYDSLQKVEAIS